MTKEARVRKLSILSGVNPNDAEFPKLQEYISDYIELVEEKKRLHVKHERDLLDDGYIGALAADDPAYSGAGIYNRDIDIGNPLRNRHMKTLERLFSDAGHPHLALALQRMIGIGKQSK